MSLVSKRNIEHINQTLLDLPRIRPALHDKAVQIKVKDADLNHRMIDMCHDLLGRFGLTDDSGVPKIAIIPNGDFDRIAFTYDLMADPDRLTEGTEKWHAECKMLSTNRNQLRKKLNSRARRLFPAFQVAIAEHGRSLRIVPIDQMAMDIPSRNMRKVSNQVIGSYQQIIDLLSRDDIKNNPIASMYLEMAKQNFEVLYSNVDVAVQHTTRNLNRFMKELNLGQPKLL